MASGEKMGFQITLFLTLAVYTTEFQQQLPVWSLHSQTPKLAFTVIISILGSYSTFVDRPQTNILVNGLSCLVTAVGLIIYHLGEEQVYKPGVWAYFFCVVMEKFLRLGPFFYMHTSKCTF